MTPFVWPAKIFVEHRPYFQFEPTLKRSLYTSFQGRVFLKKSFSGTARPAPFLGATGDSRLTDIFSGSDDACSCRASTGGRSSSNVSGFGLGVISGDHSL